MMLICGNKGNVYWYDAHWNKVSKDLLILFIID